MKKLCVVGICLLALGGFTFSADFTASGKILAGGTAVQKTWDTAFTESETEFGGAYVMGDFTLSSDKITAGGKIYYRVKNYDDSKDVDTDKFLAQEIEIKRAYLRYRPFGDKLLECSIGKLYSYYLTGNYFQLAEIYTGSSRWGKTGVGAKSQYAGFTFGAALPVTESYVEFKNYRAGVGAIEYNFAHLNKDVPVSLGFSLGAEHSYSEKQDSKTKIITETHDDEIFWTASANYAPRLNGFVSKLNATLSFSYNSTPHVASSVFKNVSNYKSVTSSNFASLNFRANFGVVQAILEGEAGHTVEGNIIPLYAGTQLLIPITDHFSFKPRFFYYAALDGSDSENSRQTFEFYPRAWITAGSWTISAGADFSHKQVAKSDWKWEWSLPFYVEYKIKN